MAYTYKNYVARYAIEGAKYEVNYSREFLHITTLYFPSILKALGRVRKSRIFGLNTLRECVRRVIDSDILDNLFVGLGHDMATNILTTYFLLRVFGLEELFPILIDDLVNEIFIDGVGKEIYLDHAIFGRLSTPLKMDRKKVRRLILLLKICSDALLAGRNPSAKVELSLAWHKLRISIDVTKDGNDAIFSIRKISGIPPFFSFLLDEGMRRIIATLMVLLALRPNVVIFGETGVGKTTLASMLLGVVPRYWRIVLIEDVAEVPDMVIDNKKAIRISVPSFELRGMLSDVKRSSWSKDREIIKLLHRSPDFCFISEIQDKEDTYAVFHAFSAGIRGIATTHARDLFGLMNRWLNTYGLPVDWVKLVDVLVFLRKNISGGTLRRELAEIYAILDERTGSFPTQLEMQIGPNRLRFLSLSRRDLNELEAGEKACKQFVEVLQRKLSATCTVDIMRSFQEMSRRIEEKLKEIAIAAYKRQNDAKGILRYIRRKLAEISGLLEEL